MNMNVLPAPGLASAALLATLEAAESTGVSRKQFNSVQSGLHFRGNPLLSGSAIGGDRIAVVFGQRLADVVDPAVFVAIDDDDAVFPADPAGLFQ